MNRKSLAVLVMVFTVFMGFMVTGRGTMAAENYDWVDLDTFVKLADDPAALAKVHSVEIVSGECNKKAEKGVKLLTKCPNLESAYICVAGLKVDKTLINNIKTTSDDLSLTFQWCTVDLAGVKNPYVDGIVFSQNTVKHYENILNFPKLEYLQTDNVAGFTQTDYRKLPHLKTMVLTGQRIEDYKTFFQQASNVHELGLKNCNLQNKDTKHIVSYMKNLENLGLYGTFVDDISFLKDIKKLKGVDLPLGVSNLDVLYEMPYLDYVAFDAYTELFVDGELTKFFDENNIAYPDFDRDIRKKVENSISSMKITDKTPVKERIKIVTQYVNKFMKCEDIDVSNIPGTTLDICYKMKTGVCIDYSTIEYTLLKCVGVDAYLIVGYSTDTLGTPPGSHAWDEVCIDGKWYGIESMWIDSTDKDVRDANWKTFYMKSTKGPSEWPADIDWDKNDDLIFAYYHRTENDPMDSIKGGGKTQPITLKLEKSSDSVVCGKSLALKETLKGAICKVSWKSSDTGVATVDSKGKVTAKSAGTATITASSMGKSASCKVTVLYKDVTDSKDFWYAPTNYLTSKGVVKGYDKQTKFKPANECTRAQMVTFIWRLMGSPDPKAKTCKFSDVKKSDYFYKACIWGNENNIVEGYKDGTFGPQIVCARKHAVTFLWRLAGKPESSSANKFSDVKKSDYFYTATLWASEKGILAGYADGTFKPNGECLRRQMVTFLYKYDKKVNEKTFGKNNNAL